MGLFDFFKAKRKKKKADPAKESAAVYELAEKIHAGWQKGGGE